LYRFEHNTSSVRNKNYDKKLDICSTLVGITITALIATLGLTTTASAEMKDVAKAEQLPTKNEMIVAYYGRPGIKSMGILGQ